MTRIFSLLFLSLFFICGFLSPLTAQAGQLFPPSNELACIVGTVLAWNADQGAVECVPALSGINVSCAGNQVLVSFQGDPTDPSNNHQVCMTLPTCLANQFLTYNNKKFSCVGLPDCQGNTTMSFDTGSSSFICKPFALPVCTAGQYLTSLDGATFTCSSLDTCMPNWTNVSASACSASCGGGISIITQSDGCGHNQNLTQTCNQQACVVYGSAQVAASNGAWTTTSNYVTAGQTVTISATGVWTIWRGGPYFDANGATWQGYWNGIVDSSAYEGILLGKIGSTIIPLGDNVTFTATTSGNLSFICNDGNFIDNSGVLTVNYSIQ